MLYGFFCVGEGERTVDVHDFDTAENLTIRFVLLSDDVFCVLDRAGADVSGADFVVDVDGIDTDTDDRRIGKRLQSLLLGGEKFHKGIDDDVVMIDALLHLAVGSALGTAHMAVDGSGGALGFQDGLVLRFGRSGQDVDGVKIDAVDCSFHVKSPL